MDQQVKDKRAAIMEASLKLFTERRFHGISTTQISKDAGVATGTLFIQEPFLYRNPFYTGTLFNYFPTKKNLINSLYFEVKSGLSLSIKEEIDAEATFQGRMKKLWSNIIRFGVNNPEEFLFIEQFSLSPYITKLTREEVMKDYVFIFDFMEYFMKE